MSGRDHIRWAWSSSTANLSTLFMFFFSILRYCGILSIPTSLQNRNSHPSCRPGLTFGHRSFTFNSNKSPAWCNNFSVYYHDVCLQLNMFRAFSRPSSGAQWLQWQPLVLPSYRGDSCAVFVVGLAGLTTNTACVRIVASGWWFMWIVRWCTDLQTLNFTFKF